MDYRSIRSDILRRPSVCIPFLVVIGAVLGSSAPLLAGTATHFSVTAPSTVVHGVPFSITVTALDASNTIDTTYVGTVHFTTSDVGAGVALPADYTFVGADNGVHTFSVTLVTAGLQTVAVKDTATSITGTGTVTVIGAATHFSVTAPPTVTTGVPFSITVTALDALNAIDTAYSDTVHFKTSDVGAGVILPGDYTFVSADNGMHTFTVTLVTLGIQTVTATDTADEFITGTSNDILVVAPTATVTPSSTPSMTPTASASPTRTPVPQGGGCSDPAQCAAGLFCSQGVCCDAPCTGLGQSCAVPGRRGDCVSTVPAEAPALSAGGLVAAVATLIASTAFALVFRRRRDRR